MIGIDTNVLVRYMMQDDVVQSAIATEVFTHISRENPGYISSVVLAELSWVLARSYKEPRKNIADVIENLLQSYDLVIENSDAGYRALTLYRSSQSVDFADALIVVTASYAGAFETVTFDRKAAVEGGMRLLESA